MKSINDVVENKKCTGCSACLNICPTGAISMVTNSEGFFVPHIDSEKCINCGLCNKVCPSLNKITKFNQYSVPKVYAGWNKDEKIRLKSSSGGVFSVLAEYTLDKGGFVCGASFGKRNELKHIIISKRVELKKLRGSKYLQSEIGYSLIKIKSLLEKDKHVLFCGTPCQTAGLRSFLKKDYEKLLIVDIVCHGAPSPMVFKKYLEEIEKEGNKSVTEINFRDKSTGWKSYSFTLSGKNKTLLKERFEENIFFEGFLKNLYLNNICTSCPYSQFPRYSDITLGDYWGIEGFKKELDDEKGVSVITINNEKGMGYFSQIKDKLFVEKVDKKNTIDKLVSISIPCEKSVNRDHFFSELSGSKQNLSSLINNCLNTNGKENTKNVAILNMRFPTNNIGAILQSYALLTLVKNFGYKPKIINYISKELNQKKDKFSVLKLDKFRENYIDYTLPCYSDRDLVALNKDFGIFIVGSDQVWNYKYLKGNFADDIGKYFLNFTLPTKKLISYAASFAENHWDGDSDEIETVKKALKRFSSISIREKSGIDICKKLFSINAESVLDPTLLLDMDEYQKLIDSEPLSDSTKNYIAYFALDQNLEKKISTNSKFGNFFSKNKYELKNIRGEEAKVLGQEKFIFNSVPTWLNHIKNSSFVITDSYHCVIFSILFKKQFVFIEREYAGNERINSLFNILGIKNRSYSTIEKIDIEMLFKEEVKYKDIYKKLTMERERSLIFLSNSLKKEEDNGKKHSLLEIELFEEKLRSKELQEESQSLQDKTQQLEMLNQDLETKNIESEKEKEILLVKVHELEFSVLSYLNSKTYKYAEIIKRVLSKMRIKRYQKWR